MPGLSGARKLAAPPVLRLLLLGLVGLGGGLAGSIAGVASLVTYPSLLAIGLAPVSANVTATVANVCGGLGSTWGSRPELVGQRRRVLRLAAVCGAGGLLGGVLLLVTPARTFTLVVPVLIAGAAVAILIRPRPDVAGRPAVSGPPADRPVLAAAVFAIAVYGGYFGAAAGVLVIAVLVQLTRSALASAVAVKNVVMVAANGVAALLFAVSGPVRWDAVIPLALGFFVGGRIGPSVVRRAPVTVLRLVIAACGIGLAAYLGVRTY